MIYDLLYRESLTRAKAAAWVFSDLQQRDPEKARECFELSLADFTDMGKPAGIIWYLGDAVEGRDLPRLREMAAMQEEGFERLGLPVCLALGNHDLEMMFAKDRPPLELPFYEAVRRHKDWHCTEKVTDWYYKIPFADHTVYFLNDHVSPEREWIHFQGVVRGDYPYFDRADALRREIAAEKTPVITASHYSFAGGNRASEMQSRLLPLPANVRLHLYGHAHIGDYKWAKENACRRISWIDWHDIPQINVSSFEHIRGRTCRSVFLHIYGDNTYGVFFRDHDRRVFTEAYFPANDRYLSLDQLKRG